MRRTFAAVILGVSLWIGSLAWSGFLMTRTVLDPGRSERIAENLYDDETIRDRLADNIAAAMAATIPDQVPVSDAELQAASRAALDSPAVRDEVVGAFVQTHRAFLGDGEPPEAIDAGAFGQAAREALVAARPDLDGALPPAPSLRVPLPTERIPNLGGPRNWLSTVVPLLALVSATGVLTAITVTTNRPAILRRAGFWAIGLSAFVLLFAFGIPALARALAPDQSEIVAAFVSALAETTRGPALVAAGLGVASIIASVVWKAAPALGDLVGGDGAPAATPTVAGPTIAGPTHAGRMPTPVARRPVWPDGSAPPPSSTPRPPRPADGPRPQRPGGQDLAEPRSGRPRPSTASSMTNHLPPTGGTPASVGREPRWVEGVGWVLDPSETGIPDDARWVPGVGYVIDGGDG